MRFIVCEKQFLYLNTDTDAVNTEMSISKFPSGQCKLLHNSFFQYDSKLHKIIKLVMPMISINNFFRKDGDQSIQYSGSTNLMSHPSLTLLLHLRNGEEVTGKN